MITTKAPDINTYIAAFPKKTRDILEQVRATIKKAAPKAEEAIKYSIPAFTYNGVNLVFFAGCKNHIGFYATPTAHESFKKELSGYKQGKGSVQFPLDEPMPLALITKIVKFNIEKLGEKQTKKKKL